MAIVAYTGNPNERSFSRITFGSWEKARMDCWHDSSLWGLHDTEANVTWADRAWESMSADVANPTQSRQQQKNLFD